MGGYATNNDAFGSSSNLTYKDALLEGENANPQQQQRPLPQQVRRHSQSRNSQPKTFRGIASRKGKKKQEFNSENDDEDRDGMSDLKSGLIISGAVMAVVGAVFAIAKSMKKA